MEWSSSARQVFSRFSDNPSDSLVLRDVGALYWDTLQQSIGELVLECRDCGPFMESERDFVDAGWIPEIRESVDLSSFRSEVNPPPFLAVQLMSRWLADTVGHIMGQDRAETLRQDIARAQAHIRRVDKEIESAQEARRELLTGEVASAEAGRFDASAKNVIAGMDGVDALTLEIMRSRRAIARGQFFGANERRALVAKEASLQKEAARIDALAAKARSDTARGEARGWAKQITELLTQKIQYEEKILKLEAAIADVRQHQETISPKEVLARVNEEIDYLRDLVKLSAKRMKAELVSVLRPDDAFFTPREIAANLNLILEFDPNLLRNDRVSFLGKPSILLVPGNGTALYDWKNNRILVPLVPPAGNFLQSLVSAMIEYRLDVDEEKKLLNSYCKLPHLKGVKSIFQIKGSFTKDYMAWMVSESKGFKVLARETRAWFEHEVAPSKNEIYCPAEYQSYNLSQAEFQKRLKDVEDRLGEQSLDQASAEDLWQASICNYQQGNVERAFACAKAYADKMPGEPFGHYNLAQIAMKAARKQDAAAGFSEFCKINAASWWAGVAQEHLRRLKL